LLKTHPGHLHGYAIAQLIQQLSDDLPRVEEGSLYRALQRLELNGWIEGIYRQVTGAVARIMGFA
jgi:PadR family transcriptional regulator, regulatory protein PadR